MGRAWTKRRTTGRRAAVLATSILLALAAASVAIASTASMSGCSNAAASAKTKLYVLSAGYTDALVIESNGVFGIVDSGESADYPDGSDPRYPLRDGIDTDPNRGVEKFLFELLDGLGVSAEKGNLQFYIGTHPHSDHIGTAYEVIERYRPKYVYTPLYDDSMISDKERLWDNQYVYDKLVNAAHQYGSVLIQTFKMGAEEYPIANENGDAVGSPDFMLGEAHISIKGFNKSTEANSIEDANEISLQVLMETNNYKTLLLGDIESVGPDEQIIAETIGKVDVLKLGHHGNEGAGSGSFIRTLSPKYVIQTGAEGGLASETTRALMDVGAKLYPTSKAVDERLNAIVFYYADRGITANMEPGELGANR